MRLCILSLALIHCHCSHFAGQYFTGVSSNSNGTTHLELLDKARRMLSPADVEFQTVTGVYDSIHFGLTEGAQWYGNFWTQNSYGFGLSSVPFLPDPLLSWLQTSYLWWYDHIGDGAQTLAGLADVPAGMLCDNGSPTGCNYMQCGPGRSSRLTARRPVGEFRAPESKRQQTFDRYKESLKDTEALGHDFIIEGTLAGSIMQAELLLATRNISGAAAFLTYMKQTSDFMETRRVQDPSPLTPNATGLFFAGNGANLLAPAFGGQGLPVGCLFNLSCGAPGFPPCCQQRGFSYLTGLSVTYSGLLDRMIQLEQMAFPQGRQCSKPNDSTENISSCVDVYTRRRQSNNASLDAVTTRMPGTKTRYFMKSLSPDGEQHGVYSPRPRCLIDAICPPQTRHGYFETSPNVDAIALNVVDAGFKQELYNSMLSVQGLSPCGFTLPNFPDYDDACGECIWGYGWWVSGGHWATLEGRVILAHYDQRRHDLAAASMARLLDPYAALFKLDSPLAHIGCGPGTYSEGVPGPILDVDIFAIPAAFIRGVLGYEYGADQLRLQPRLPADIEQLTQLFPVRWGEAQLFFSLNSSDHSESITSVFLNKTRCDGCVVDGGLAAVLPWRLFAEGGPTAVTIGFGNSVPQTREGQAAFEKWQSMEQARQTVVPPEQGPCALNATIVDWIRNITGFLQRMEVANLMDRFEAAQGQAFFHAVNVSVERCEGRRSGSIPPMPKQPPQWAEYNMSYDQNATEAYFPDVYGRIFRGLCSTVASYNRANASPVQRQVLTQFWASVDDRLQDKWATADLLNTQQEELQEQLEILQRKLRDL